MHHFISLINLLLLLDLLFVFNLELFNENTQHNGVEHGVHHIDCTHQNELRLRSCIHFDQRERKRGIVCQVCILYHKVGKIFIVYWYRVVDRSTHVGKIRGGHPNLISFE